MKRTIITTCGTSLLSSSCWEYRNLNEKHLSHLEDEYRLMHEMECNSLLKEACDCETDISEDFDCESWRNLHCLKDLPAELASLRAIQECFETERLLGENNKVNPLGENDQVLLLHSDDKEGKYCAEMLCKVLTCKNLLNGVEIKTKEIEKLDPCEKEGFGKALDVIWKGMINRSADQNTRYFLNLTGGYKGTSILFGALAYHISRINIFYLHEKTAYKEILLMGFDMRKEPKDRFYTDVFTIEHKKFNLPPGNPSKL